VETGKARQQLLQPVEGTIWFAGEALYDGIAPGTVEAALTSGQEVAEKIIAQS
jgi:predicted NAD/FAD-dependent oxidoreductase